MKNASGGKKFTSRYTYLLVLLPFLIVVVLFELLPLLMLIIYSFGSDADKTVLFTLNPADNAALATLTGSYSRDGVKGKVQFGPAWWYNDHLLGMTDHLETLAAYSLMPQFVGMTTDSRNVLSFSRHDYFRRVLCNWMADKVLRGLFPSDEAYLGQIAADMSYNNANNWFGL